VALCLLSITFLSKKYISQCFLKNSFQNDGGRAAAGFKGQTGDCVVRSIVTAIGMPCQKVQ
jgi:hypothetical protein